MSPLLFAVAVPLAFALIALAIPSERVRPWLLPVAALVQIPVLALLVRSGAPATTQDWLGLDRGAMVKARTVVGAALTAWRWRKRIGSTSCCSTRCNRCSSRRP